MARGLERASRWLALAGGAVLAAAALLTTLSVLGRWLWAAPITGDIELMQIACVVAIALFLPHCQLHCGHVQVDLFTRRAGAALRARLDRAGHALGAAVMLLLAWRAAVGVGDMWAAGETTMLLGVPLWIAYLAMVPGLLLSALVALVAAGDGSQR